MSKCQYATKKERLKDTIAAEVFIPASKEYIANKHTGGQNKNGWIFDFRRVLMQAPVLRDVSDLFWETFTDPADYQVCGLEVAAIPLVTGIMLGAERSGEPNASGFFIRKSRKKDGLMRMIEGTIVPKKKIVLVDDIMYSGKSMVRQVEVLEELGYSVHAVWVILRFRDKKYYEYFHNKNIAVHSLFELNDFAESLELTNRAPLPRTPVPMPFTIEWKFAAPEPNYFYVVPKSNPVIDDTKVYFGSDSGVFWALNQADGTTAWSYRVGLHAKGKSLFSSPAMHKDTVYFGSYDGNFYALDAQTGKKKWIYFEADWVGSSPAIAGNLGLVFVGLEFGLWRKRGGIVALDAQTGKKLWDYTMPAYTHASPCYIAKHKQVAIGSNDGSLYLFNAKTGKLIWQYKTYEPTDEELGRGFSAGDIKESCAYDVATDLLMVGNKQGLLTAVQRKTGESAWNFSAQFGFYSTPYIYKDRVLASSLDKYLYCLDVKTGKELWRWHAGARIFATPTVINGKVYIGANTGRLTELDIESGKETGFITVPERITNTVVCNKETGQFFLPTFANELYCLTRKTTD